MRRTRGKAGGALDDEQDRLHRVNMAATVSLIIPVWNEQPLLERGEAYYRRLSRFVELIFVDGGSDDGSVETARRYGRLIRARERGRAVQMNEGAYAAKGTILLFMHADCRLVDVTAVTRIEHCLNHHGVVAGGFTHQYDDPRMVYRWIAVTGNWRARWSGIVFGDQGLFLQRDVFAAVGGFPRCKVAEDVLLCHRLRRLGRVVLSPDRVICSARRWRENGLWRTFWLNRRILWTARYQPHQLDRWAQRYYGRDVC